MNPSLGRMKVRTSGYKESLISWQANKTICNSFLRSQQKKYFLPKLSYQAIKKHLSHFLTKFSPSMLAPYPPFQYVVFFLAYLNILSYIHSYHTYILTLFKFVLLNNINSKQRNLKGNNPPDSISHFQHQLFSFSWEQTSLNSYLDVPLLM